MAGTVGITFQLASTILKKRGYMSYVVGTPTKVFMRAAIKFILDNAASSAINLKTNNLLKVAVVQCHLKLSGFDPHGIDGLSGPDTQYALERYLKGPTYEYFRDTEKPPSNIIWPRESQLDKFYGPKGKNQVKVHCPYELYFDWAPKSKTNSITINEKCAPSLERCLAAIHKEYGDAKIKALKLNSFGGSLNVRFKRGSSHQWSTHSWGAAIDWWPIKNQYKWPRPKALLSDKIYIPFWEIWEAEGWVSLGRARNYDWMHIQAVSL